MGVIRISIFAVFFIIIFFFSLWLYGGLDHNWDHCLHHSIQKHKSVSLYRSNTSSKAITPPLKVCPGQKFQVVYLLRHLQEAAPVSTKDVLLKPYLASWDELIKFMETLGPMVGIISQEIEAKTSIIRKLAQKEEDETNQQVQDSNTSGAYVSVRSMIISELERGLVNFDQFTESGCRTLLRLHRALLWLQLFLHSLAEEKKEMIVRSPSELCREAYRLTLAQHHSWWVKRAAELAFVAMPDRPFFYKLMCVRAQAEAAALLNRVVKAIQEVYNRTQVALEEHDMLALP